MDNKRIALLRSLPTELLMEMINNIDELSEEGQQKALEEIIYILYEREVKTYE